MQYYAVDGSLNVLRGFLGHTDYAGAHADSVNSYKAAVDTIIRQFCTTSIRAGGAQQDFFREDLYHHMCSIHEVWDSDAARCMFLLGMEVSHAWDGPALFENNRLVVKDHTHAARRFP